MNVSEQESFLTILHFSRHWHSRRCICFRHLDFIQLINVEWVEINHNTQQKYQKNPCNKLFTVSAKVGQTWRRLISGFGELKMSPPLLYFPTAFVVWRKAQNFSHKPLNFSKSELSGRNLRWGKAFNQVLDPRVGSSQGRIQGAWSLVLVKAFRPCTWWRLSFLRKF